MAARAVRARVAFVPARGGRVETVVAGSEPPRVERPAGYHLLLQVGKAVMRAVVGPKVRT